MHKLISGNVSERNFSKFTIPKQQLAKPIATQIVINH